MSRAELLRPFADAPCQTPEFHHLSSSTRKCASCGGLERNSSGLDTRFAALRGEHDWLTALEKRVPLCRLCDEYQGSHAIRPYCPRTDVGSVLRAAAARGDEVFGKVLQRIDDAYSSIGGFWQEEPEDAAAAAFAAAMQGRAS